MSQVLLARRGRSPCGVHLRTYCLYVLRSVLITIVAVAPLKSAAAIDITVHYVERTRAFFDLDGSQLVGVFNNAAQIWEDYLPAAGTYNVDVSWDCDLHDQDFCGGTGTGPIGEWSFQFGGNNNIRVSPDSDFRWYFDNDAGHTEFDMGQRLYRDFSAAMQDFWFDGSPPQLLEIGYHGSTNDPQLEDRYDLLTVALHLLGHELGVNDSGGPWEVNSAFLPTGTVVLDEVGGTWPASGHLLAGGALMSRMERGVDLLPGTRVFPSAIDIMAVADDEDFDVIDLPRQDYVGMGTWHTASNWFGGATPDSDDHALLRAGADVTLGADARVENLSLAESAYLTTLANRLIVDNTATIVGAESTPTQVTIPTGGELQTVRLSIGGGKLELDGGVVDVNGLFEIGTIPGSLTGHGTVEQSTELRNNGTIRPHGGTLLIQLSSASNVNLDGTSESGTVDATSGNLSIVGGGLADPFDGMMTIGPGQQVSVQDGWILGTSGQLTLQGQGFDFSAVEGGNLVVRGSIDVLSDIGAIKSTVDFQPTADVAVSTNALLFLDGLTTFRGGTFTGDGTLVQNADATVAVGTTTTIDLHTYDMDGPDNTPATITILGAAQLLVDSQRIEIGETDGFDGTLNLVNGLLRVATHEVVPRLGRDPRPWRMEGTLNLNGSARVEGSRMIVGDAAGRGAVARLNGLSGHALVSAPITFESTAVVVLEQDAQLSLTSSEPTIYQGGSFTGPSGSLRQTSDAIIAADTQIDIGLYDMDGALEGSTITIEPGVHFTVNAMRIEDGDANDFDGSIGVRGGTLDVRPHQLSFTPRGGLVRTDRPWRMEGMLELNHDSGPARVAGNKMFVGQSSAGQPAARVTVGPGQAILDVDAEFEQRSVLEFELGGTGAAEFGQLYASTSSSLTIGGTVAASLVGGFLPSDGDRFTIITTENGVTGAFSDMDLPSLGPSSVWQIDYSADTVTLEVIAGMGSPSLIQGVSLFYNESAFDGNGPAVGAGDAAAIATDKAPLRFGETASFANISGYHRGITGLVIDMDGLPFDGAALDAQDFTFTLGNDDFPDTWDDTVMPASVDVLPGAGEDGSDRVFVTFADGAVTDTWLHMTVKANGDTGLVADEDFFFGAAPGETGASFLPNVVGVDAVDLQWIAQNLTPLADSGTELITERSDLNRDGSVNAFDFLVVAIHLDPNVIQYISPQMGAAAAAQAAVPEPATLLLIGMCLATAAASRQFVRRGSRRRTALMTVLTHTCAIRSISLATYVLVLTATPATAITTTPSWETPEHLTGSSSSLNVAAQMRGQDRWLDFNHFGIAGLAVSQGHNVDLSFYQRLPAAGWTRQTISSGEVTHPAFQYDRAERPVLLSIGLEEQELVVRRPDRLSPMGGWSQTNLDTSSVKPEQDITNSGTSLAMDPLGRMGVAYIADGNVAGNRFLNFNFDANGDGDFNDIHQNNLLICPNQSCLGMASPSLAFDPQARAHIATIDTAASRVNVITIDVGGVGGSLPDPDVDSTFVSLAINPTTGFPAVAYNDLEGNALKYAEWEGQSWRIETVEVQETGTNTMNMPVSLAFDPADGLPAIAYAWDFPSRIGGQPPPIDVLRFAWHDGTNWNTQTVDSTSHVATGAVSLAFNEALGGGFGDGLPAIAYVSDSTFLRYVHDPPLLELPGDYNANGQVEQGDLDLVLAHWGQDGSTPPVGWIRYKPDGFIDQQELDAVLTAWGNVTSESLANTAAVPEPRGLALLLAGLACTVVRRRGPVARRRGP